MWLDEFLIRREAESAIERDSEEVFDVCNLRHLLVDVHLEEIALTGAVDAHGHSSIAEGALEHRFGQVDQREPSEEVCALDQTQRKAVEEAASWGMHRMIVPAYLFRKDPDVQIGTFGETVVARFGS